MNKAFFITGTGTGIGKTVVTCSLIHQLIKAGKKVSAIKPVISGWEDNSTETDTIQILTCLGLSHTQENIETISPWRFKEPLAPSMAARKEGRDVDYAKLVNFCKSVHTNDYLLCEGAGGVMVPLNKNKTTLDLMHDIGMPAILVAGSYLGSLSHTMTAVKSLEGAGVEIQAIIVNESENGIALADIILELKGFINQPIYPFPRILGNRNIWERTDNILECIIKN